MDTSSFIHYVPTATDQKNVEDFCNVIRLARKNVKFSKFIKKERFLGIFYTLEYDAKAIEEYYSCPGLFIVVDTNHSVGDHWNNTFVSFSKLGLRAFNLKNIIIESKDCYLTSKDFKALNKINEYAKSERFIMHAKRYEYVL